MIIKSVDLIKNLLSEGTKSFDMKTLYKMASQAFVDKALQQKDVLVQAVVNECKKFLETANLTEEIRKITEGMTVHLTVSFEFKKPEGKTPAKTAPKKSKS